MQIYVCFVASKERERLVFSGFINYIYSLQKQNAFSLMVKTNIGGSILVQVRNVLSKIALSVILDLSHIFPHNSALI